MKKIKSMWNFVKNFWEKSCIKNAKETLWLKLLDIYNEFKIKSKLQELLSFVKINCSRFSVICCEFKTKIFKALKLKFAKFLYFLKTIPWLWIVGFVSSIFCLFFSLKFIIFKLLSNEIEIEIWIKALFLTITPNIFLLVCCLYFLKDKTKKLPTIWAIMQIKKFVWGVQIQSFKTTSFALGFTIFITIYFSCFCDLSNINSNNLNYADNYAEGATQIMIAIGTSLMAMAILFLNQLLKKEDISINIFYLE